MSIAEERGEFLAQEAEAARVGAASAEQRAAAAEARAVKVEQEAEGLERALKREELRAFDAEGEAADARSAAGTLRWDALDLSRVEEMERRLEESETSRKRLTEEIERLAGQGSLLDVEHTAQQVRRAITRQYVFVGFTVGQATVLPLSIAKQFMRASYA